MDKPEYNTRAKRRGLMMIEIDDCEPFQIEKMFPFDVLGTDSYRTDNLEKILKFYRMETDAKSSVRNFELKWFCTKAKLPFRWELTKS